MAPAQPTGAFSFTNLTETVRHGKAFNVPLALTALAITQKVGWPLDISLDYVKTVWPIIHLEDPYRPDRQPRR